MLHRQPSSAGRKETLLNDVTNPRLKKSESGLSDLIDFVVAFTATSSLIRMAVN